MSEQKGRDERRPASTGDIANRKSGGMKQGELPSYM